MNKNVMFISPNALESYRKSKRDDCNIFLSQLRANMVWKVVPSPHAENLFMLEPDYGLGHVSLLVNKRELDTYFEEI